MRRANLPRDGRAERETGIHGARMRVTYSRRLVPVPDSTVDLSLRPANFSDRPKDEIVNESSAALPLLPPSPLPPSSIRNMI